MAPNPLVSDRNIEFLLYEVFDVEALCRLPAYKDHSRETFDLVLLNARKFAREVLLPTYKPMDEAPPRLEGGGIRVHPAMKQLFPRLVEQGTIAAARPHEVGGQQLPHTIPTDRSASREQPDRRQDAGHADRPRLLPRSRPQGLHLGRR